MKPKIKSIKESLFLRNLKLAKSNPNKIGLMILFDVLFLISVYALYTLSLFFAQTIFIEKSLSTIFIFLIFSLTYYLIIIFAYSFFKFMILDLIKSLFDITKFSFKRLGLFYSLNIIIAGIFFAILLSFNFILASVKQVYAPFVFLFLAIPYLLFLYIIINTSHSIFYEGASIKETIKKSFKITFTKIKIYRETILIMILFALILWLLFLGSGYLIRFIGTKNYATYLTTYKYFRHSSIIVFDVIFYFLILINRISFYMTVKKFTTSS